MFVPIWAEGEAAYQDGDWQNALAFMTLARRIDPRYQGAAGDRMLFESHVGLAADAIAKGNLEDSLEHLDAAVALRPDVGRVKTIQAALQALVAPGTLNIAIARWSLVTALGSYAQELLDARESVRGGRAAAGGRCAGTGRKLGQAAGGNAGSLREGAARCQMCGGSLPDLTGRLLYSTQEGDAYRIYRVPATLGADSALLIDDGSQPARQWHSNVVAFHSTQADSPGIALFDPSAGQSPTKRSLQLTTSAGDAHDAPPSWSENDRSLVYGNTAPDGRTRIFRTEVTSTANAVDLGPGRDPDLEPKARPDRL